MFIGDEAAANKRFVAQAELKAMSMRKFLIVWFGPCILHILHRSVLPSLKFKNISGDLYRVSHVLEVESYGTTLCTTQAAT